jgi:hypothetical protein
MRETPLEPGRARRAIGAMFFAAFGGVWLGFYTLQVAGPQLLPIGVIALATGVLLALTYRRYRQHRPALLAEPPSPERKRADRVFHIINAGQWVVIVVAANVLVNFGLSVWVIPLVIGVVGLHFLPLARVFAYRPHWVTGAALILLSVAYPLLASQGPASPVGSLGAGLILWASALWAVRGGAATGRVGQRPDA